MNKKFIILAGMCLLLGVETLTAAVTYRVYATRIGLVGNTTANGHVIQPNDRFVALPHRSVLNSQGSYQYTVNITNPANGRSVSNVPVWDIGPWNCDDNYWALNRSSIITPSLPRGLPQAEAAYYENHHSGRDFSSSCGPAPNDRTVLNPAGIDLADGTYWDDLEMSSNGWVDVTFNWAPPEVFTTRHDLGGYYRMKAKHSGKYFDMGPDHVSNGASLQQFDWHGGSNQVYQLTHLGDGYYRIRSKSAPETRVLDVAGCGASNGSNVHQWDWFDNDCQKFRIQDVGGGYVRFVAKNSGRVLEVGGENGANGANINIWDWNGSDHQKFQLEWVSIPVTNLNGAYKVASAHNGRVLDIAPDHASNGAVLQIYDWLDLNNQKFTFDHLGGGWYKIWAASAGSNRVLDVPGCDFSNGTPLWQWDWFDNDCQKFLVEEVAPGQVRIKSVGGTVLDHGLPGDNGTSVVLWDWWGGANQRWTLESAVAGPPPQEVIVDNADAGFSASGSWNSATWASDKYESDYHYRATASVSDRATWTVNLPSAGTYAVYAWWTAASNRATLATYVVEHVGGTANVQVDQTQNGGQWNSLGSYSMNAGANEIHLSCWTSSGDVVVADAVRYVK